MSCFSNQIRFIYPWRRYQQRVLDELVQYMQDDHLHVIAPPGSGKTVLGLEVMLRIGKPTLILAPTLAIRNQWIQRFCDLFLQDSTIPSWVSKDIRNPGLITVVTYQGLHSACNDLSVNTVGFESETDVKTRTKSNFQFLKNIAEGLKKVAVETFILDESHHLKNEWWQTLTRLKNELMPKIVGLTATPPYDVSPLEWSRYVEMNGPVDVEITVPELMAENDLCPHQDYVYFTSVSKEELEEINRIRKRTMALYSSLKSDSFLLKSIQAHPIIVDPLNNENYIFSNTDFYLACLIFLKENEVIFSLDHYKLLGLIQDNEAYVKGEQPIPRMDLPILEEKWMEIILRQILFTEPDYWDEFYGEEKELLEDKLRRAGAIERKSICFTKNSNIDKKISASITKLEAISEIVELEYGQLKHDLRQVILADYVRKEYLVSSSVNDMTLRRMGVMSIFEKLRRNNKQGIRLGVLTGTLVIIPNQAYSQFLEISSNLNLHEVSFSPLCYDEAYLQCYVDDRCRDQIVYLITQLFEHGFIETLIGTKALLGEGWDAPAINSLILASVIGSFVSSNQMRGRAIRTSALNPNKSSNIWHVACVDPSADNGGTDVDLIWRRFKNFVGLSEIDAIKIQNGFERLGLFEQEIEVGQIENYNMLTRNRAKQRKGLKARWAKAIPYGSELVEEIKIPYFNVEIHKAFQATQMRKTVRNMTATLVGSVVFYIEMSTSIFNTIGQALGLSIRHALMALLGVGVLFFARRAIKAYYYYTRYRDVTKDIYQIGNALVQTLCKNRIFTSPWSELKVLTFSDDQGYVYCHLDKGTTYEKSVFVQMMQEIVDPIHNPRYIIVRKSKLVQFFQQIDYHAVPDILGKKAALANDLLNFWRLRVGEAELIYTKNQAGCELLIQSRFKALSRLNDNRKLVYVSSWR